MDPVSAITAATTTAALSTSMAPTVSSPSRLVALLARVKAVCCCCCQSGEEGIDESDGDEHVHRTMDVSISCCAGSVTKSDLYSETAPRNSHMYGSRNAYKTDIVYKARGNVR